MKKRLSLQQVLNLEPQLHLNEKLKVYPSLIKIYFYHIKFTILKLFIEKIK